MLRAALLPTSFVRAITSFSLCSRPLAREREREPCLNSRCSSASAVAGSMTIFNHYATLYERH